MDMTEVRKNKTFCRLKFFHECSPAKICWNFMKSFLSHHAVHTPWHFRHWMWQKVHFSWTWQLRIQVKYRFHLPDISCGWTGSSLSYSIIYLQCFPTELCPCTCFLHTSAYLPAPGQPVSASLIIYNCKTMPGSKFRLCPECQAHMWVAYTKCRECGAQQPALVPSGEWAWKTVQRLLNPKNVDKAAAGLVSVVNILLNKIYGMIIMYVY